MENREMENRELEKRIEDMITLEKTLSSQMTAKNRALERRIMSIETMLCDIYDEVIKEKKVCPVCKSEVRLFLAAGESLRRNACCPVCHSFERHRAFWLYLEKNWDTFFPAAAAGIRVLHFAPEPGLAKRFRSIDNVDYYPVDIDPEFPDICKAVDITNITYGDNYFDLVIANHVIEHIPDEQKALSEIKRVLKPSGVAFINAPVFHQFAETLEKEEYNTPELRSRYYGQRDHVRRYGRDYIEHLHKAGFTVTKYLVGMEFTEEEQKHFGLDRTEEMYECRKDR